MFAWEIEWGAKGELEPSERLRARFSDLCTSSFGGSFGTRMQCEIKGRERGLVEKTIFWRETQSKLQTSAKNHSPTFVSIIIWKE